MNALSLLKLVTPNTTTSRTLTNEEAFAAAGRPVEQQGVPQASYLTDMDRAALGLAPVSRSWWKRLLGL